MEAILGIDIGKREFHAALLTEQGERIHSFPNNPAGFTQLGRWLRNRRVDRVHACLEATGRYGDALALWLHHAGHVVSVVNPAAIKSFAASELKRTKTDAVDAGVIARFCRSHTPPAWTPPDPEIDRLRQLVRRRNQLVRGRQQELTRRQTPGLHADMQQSLAFSLAFLEAEIARVEGLIRQYLRDHPELRRNSELLATIPGIGEFTAALLLGEIPDVHQFRSAKQLAAYAGLTPRHKQSGGRAYGQSRLCKLGNAQLRRSLFMPTLSAMVHNPILRALAQRLRAAGKSKMVIVGALMRKLLHIVYGVLTSGRPFDPSYQSPVRAPVTSA